MKNSIKQILEDRFNREIVLERPRSKEFGHFATPVAFSMAKELRKSPMVIAEDLAKELDGVPQFAKVEPVKGYINLHLSEEFLNSHADEALLSEDNFGRGDKNERVLLEFVSANPTGPLHIGHARGAIYGDTLLRLGRHLGYKIDAEYYINDAGRQIDLLGLSLYYAGSVHIVGRYMAEPEEYYRGDYIIDLAKEAHSELSDDIFSEKDREDNISKLSSWGKEMMMEEIKSNLFKVGIEFDLFVSEKSLYTKWNDSLKELKKLGGIFEQDDKLWLKSTEHGDEKDRVVVRENGVPTYLAGDIIYHHNKFERDYDKYINIWGADHHGYIKRVESAIEFLGYSSQRLEVLLTQMVSLLKNGQPYKMSKRAGNFILMRDVVEEVGSDAIRFTFASKRPDISLEFDLSDLTKEDSSNPIYYINYAHARIHSLLSKSSFSQSEIMQSRIADIDLEQKELLFNALRLPEVIEEAFNHRETQKLTEYLHSLASSYHSFYNNTPVVGVENEKSLLKLSLVVANSIKTALKIMGIEAKNRM
jgi:arginyl-tRNA synthetase